MERTAAGSAKYLFKNPTLNNDYKLFCKSVIAVYEGKQGFQPSLIKIP